MRRFLATVMKRLISCGLMMGWAMTAASAQVPWTQDEYKAMGCRDHARDLIGLTRDKVRAQCGLPQRSYVHTSAQGQSEILTFGLVGGPAALTVYLDNDVVTSVSTSR